MKELTIIAEILFLETAKESFNFPIYNSIRTSFWLRDESDSTFSEITTVNKQMELGEKTNVKIRLLEREFLKGKVLVGTEFNLGVYPKTIAIGKVVRIE